MLKLISPKIHGVLDYLSAATMLVLPRLLGWSPTGTLLLTILGLFTVLYSLVTRYELSLAKLLPFRGHLLIDALSGVSLVTAAFLVPVSGSAEFAGLVALGLFELAVVVLTRPVAVPTPAEVSR